jgi:hypothetical protein
MLVDWSRHYSIVSIGVLLAAVAGTEARAQMSAPLVGLIAGESPGSNEIRPVLGVLGASSVRAPFSLPVEHSRVYLAPTGSWALVQQRGAAPGLVTFQGIAPSAVQAIAGVAPNPDLVSFSPLGRSAGLYSADGVIQVLTGLDATPKVGFQMGFHDPSGVKKMTVNDEGQLLAVLTAAGQVYLLSSSMAPLLAYAGSPSLGIAFLPNQSTAVIADGGNGTMNLARIVNGMAVVQTVSGSLGSSGGDTLVEASLDGASAFVVATGSASACRVDLTAGSMQSIILPVVATRLDRLRDGASFVFSAQPGSSAWFLTGRDNGLQAVFAAAASTKEVSRR